MAEKETPLYNPHEGFRGRDGGPYLDIVERETAEVQRARVEGRDIDIENPGLVAGTPAVVAAYVTDNLPSNPGSSVLDGPGEVLNEFKDNPDKFVQPVQVVTQEVPDEDEQGNPFVSGAESTTESEDTPESAPSAEDTPSDEPQEHTVNPAPGFPEVQAPKFADKVS